MSQRSNALNQLAIQVNTVSIKTVVLANISEEEDVALANYSSSEVPLIRIVPTEEIPDYMKSSRGHALWSFSVGLTCYFLDDIGGETQQETLVKEIKDAIGGDSTLNETCADCSIESIRVAGEFPLWKLEFALEITYEKGIDNA